MATNCFSVKDSYFVVFFMYDKVLEHIAANRIGEISEDNDNVTVNYPTSYIDDYGRNCSREVPYEGVVVFSGSSTACKNFISEASKIDLVEGEFSVVLEHLKDMGLEKKKNSGKRGARKDFKEIFESEIGSQTPNKTKKEKFHEKLNNISKKEGLQVGTKEMSKNTKKKTTNLPSEKVRQMQAFAGLNLFSVDTECETIKDNDEKTPKKTTTTVSLGTTQNTTATVGVSFENMVNSEKSVTSVRITPKKSGTKPETIPKKTTTVVGTKPKQSSTTVSRTPKKTATLVGTTSVTTTVGIAAKKSVTTAGTTPKTTTTGGKPKSVIKGRTTPSPEIATTKSLKKKSTKVGTTPKKTATIYGTTPKRAAIIDKTSPKRTATIFGTTPKKTATLDGSTPKRTATSDALIDGTTPKRTATIYETMCTPKKTANTVRTSEKTVTTPLSEVVGGSMMSLLMDNTDVSPMDMNTTGEYGYNYALSTKTSDVSLNDLLDIRCYFDSLPVDHKTSIVGFVSCLANALQSSQCQPPAYNLRTPTYKQEFTTMLHQDAGATSTMPSKHYEKKVELIVDKRNPDRFKTVLVNPVDLRKIEQCALLQKSPGIYLLNKVGSMLFSREEFMEAKGVSDLNTLKQEALQEYLAAKCQCLEIEQPSSKDYRLKLQNKITNSRFLARGKTTLKKLRNSENSD